MADAADSKTEHAKSTGDSDQLFAGFSTDTTPSDTSADGILTIADSADAALAAALGVATKAGDLDAIKMIATELRERRLAASGVVDISVRRGSR